MSVSFVRSHPGIPWPAGGTQVKWNAPAKATASGMPSTRRTSETCTEKSPRVCSKSKRRSPVALSEQNRPDAASPWTVLPWNGPVASILPPVRPAPIRWSEQGRTAQSVDRIQSP